MADLSRDQREIREELHVSAHPAQAKAKAKAKAGLGCAIFKHSIADQLIDLYGRSYKHPIDQSIRLELLLYD